MPMFIPPLRNNSTTWALRPATAAVGDLIRFTDVGIGGGSLFMFDGTLWRPLNGHVVLAKSTTTSNHTGNTNETTLATIPIPAGIMSTHGVLRILPLFSSTSSANTKFYRVKLGSSTIWAAAFTTTRLIQTLIVIRNVGAANLQHTFSDNNTIGLGALAAAATSFNENTANDLNLTITGQLNNAADVITLNGYTVELMI